MHPLRVLQVTRRIVRDVERQRSTWPRPSFCEQLGDITHREAKSSRCLAPQEMPVILEQCATPGAIHSHQISLAGQGGQITRRECPSGAAIACVLVQGTTADLAIDLDYPIAVGLESP